MSLYNEYRCLIKELGKDREHIQVETREIKNAAFKLMKAHPVDLVTTSACTSAKHSITLTMDATKEATTAITNATEAIHKA